MSGNNICEYTYEKVSEIKDFLLSKCDFKPKVGIICGSGLGSITELIKAVFTIDYEDIPHFPESTVEGHRGRLIFGHISNVPVMCMQGRFHFYEGYPLTTCVMPVRLMRLFGATHLVASNAAGAINPSFGVGDVMLLKDHFNLMGLAGIGPLVGYNDSRWGPRFSPMTKAYDRGILEGIKTAYLRHGLKNPVEGVYTCAGGPNFETVAEVKGLKSWGVDAVGMSTVHEVIAARHCGLKCFAFSLITNICSDGYDYEEDTSSEEHLGVGKDKQDEVKFLIENVVKYIGENC